MIRIVTGDATKPISNGPVIIAHGCNDIGKWGKGFVVPLAEVYPEAKEQYLRWHKEDSWVDKTMVPGAVQFVYPTGTDVCIANMITQVGVKSQVLDDRLVRPIRYDAVQQCLEKVRVEAKKLKASVHMPKIGAGLAGGEWDVIYRIIEKVLMDVETTIYIYDNKEKKTGSIH